jgi:hypothetical protein
MNARHQQLVRESAVSNDTLDKHNTGEIGHAPPDQIDHSSTIENLIRQGGSEVDIGNNIISQIVMAGRQGLKAVMAESDAAGRKVFDYMMELGQNMPGDFQYQIRGAAAYSMITYARTVPEKWTEILGNGPGVARSIYFKVAKVLQSEISLPGKKVKVKLKGKKFVNRLRPYPPPSRREPPPPLPQVESPQSPRRSTREGRGEGVERLEPRSKGKSHDVIKKYRK